MDPATNLSTRVEPQQIVAQRLLSCLQYPVLAKSSTEDLTRPSFFLFRNSVLPYPYTNSGQGSDIIRRMVAVRHWLLSQPRYQISEPTVPLVLSWITVATTISSVG